MKAILGSDIIIPEISQVPRQDLAFENQLLSLIESQKWNPIAAIYTEQNLFRIYDLTSLIMILFRLFTEEGDEGDDSSDVEGPVKIVSEIYVKRSKMLLPIDLLILGQFMA